MATETKKGKRAKSTSPELLLKDIRRNTKRIFSSEQNAVQRSHDKVLLRKRALIESVNDQLKNICQIEHTRHRSVHNFCSNLPAGLIDYQSLEKKLSLDLEHVVNSLKGHRLMPNLR